MSSASSHTSTVIRIGTRKSPLALAQANEIKARLQSAFPEKEAELVPMQTSGDRFLSQNLSEIGGKNLFTKEIEDALLNGSVDIAVHSMKDMPTVLPEGLVIAAMPEREDVRDVLVGAPEGGIKALSQGAAFGTSSLRRAAQVLLIRPDMHIVPMRGNVQTRLEKLARGDAAATLLARAGLNRLGLDIGVTLPIEDFLPAVGQGAIGIECRAADTKLRDKLAALSHKPTELAVHCERTFLAGLDGSCRTPIAGHAMLSEGRLTLRGMWIKNGICYRIEKEGSPDQGESLGAEAAKELKARMG